MAIATYFHPKSLSADQYDEAIKDSKPRAPRARQAGSITRASGPTRP